MAVLAFLGFLLLPGAAAKAADPPKCKVGVYLISVHDIDASRDTFDADLWIWSVCPEGARDPLPAMEFSNAVDSSTSLHATEPVEGGVLSELKLRGTFQAGWDARTFPFDRHRLTISLEETLDTTDFVLVPDTANSAYSPTTAPSGWAVTGFELVDEPNTYRTNFGDSSLAAGEGSTFSRLQVHVDLARSEYTSFFKLAGPVYLAFIITVLTFILVLESVEVMLGRLGLFGAMLFALVVNLQQSAAVIGSTGAWSLVDRIHITGLAFTILMTGVTLTTWASVRKGADIARTTRRERIWVLVAGVAFLLINVLMIIPAATSR